MSGTTSQRWVEVQVRVPHRMKAAVRECVERFLESPPRKIEDYPHQANFYNWGNVLPDGRASQHRKDDNIIDIRSLTPPQAAGNALAYAVQESGGPFCLVAGVVPEDASLSFRLKRLDEALREIEQREGLFEPLTVDLEAVVHPKGGTVEQGGILYVGRRLIICPPSLRDRVSPMKGKSILYIQPLQAFGDGRHPSTVLALRLIESLLEDSSGQAPRRGLVLDAGCGTGILSLAAAALGDFQVFGVDISEDAIIAAKANQGNNGGAGRRVQFVRGGFSCARGPFCIVMANLVASVHTGAFGSLWDSTASGGRLVLSGFSPGQKNLVTGPYLERGAEEIAFLREQGWAGVVLFRPEDGARHKAKDE